MFLTKSFRIVPFVSVLLMIGSCASNEIGQSRDVNQQTVYQQYDVQYDEAGNTATLTAWFRFAGVNGTTLVLNEPSRFECDGETIKVDSSEFSGAFYKTVLQADRSLGRHRLVFTDIDKKRYENEFSLDRFQLEQVPASIRRADSVNIFFEGPALEGKDYIELTTDNTDSAFNLTHLATDQGNYITIPAAQLQRQKGKAFSLYATLYRERPLLRQTKEGGLISTRQSTRPVSIAIRD